jgi:TonB family protein
MIPAAAVNIVEGIGHALTYLHGLGITHADVKPGNILVSAEGHATLLDLGVALGPDSGDRVSAHGYTPQYASPEVLNGALPTPADDLFSLACVAYRLLTGQRAFGAADACEAAASGERPARPDNLSPAQWRALDQALSFRRADRQHDVHSFLAQLSGSRTAPVAAVDPVAEPAAERAPDLVGDPVAAQPVMTTLPAADRRWNLGRWWPAAALVAVVLAVATLFPDPPPDTPPPTAAEASTAAPANPPAPAAPVAVKRNPARKVVAVAASPRPQAPRPRPEVSQPESGKPPQTDPQQPDRARRESPAPETPVTEPAAAELLPEAPVAAALSTPDGALPDTAVPPAADGQRVAFSRLKVRRYVEPKYPRNALIRRVAGWVEVAFTVDTSGRTRDVRVLKSDPPGIFEDAALSAVKRWRFDTAGSTAVAAPVDSEIRLRFQPQ